MDIESSVLSRRRNVSKRGNVDDTCNGVRRFRRRKAGPLQLLGVPHAGFSIPTAFLLGLKLAKVS